ncbi:MAG: aminopeptidase P family protein [Armatimonadota bacterium]|nr:MAG: aminopeptidase P family protein [Armatimonadota bacterium]
MMTEEHADRVARLRTRMRESELDGLVVSAPSNVFYLSGFRGSSGALLITPEQAALVSDFRYRLQGREQAPAFEFVEVERHLYAGVGRAASQRGVRRLGYDAAHLSCEGADELSQAAPDLDLVAASSLVEHLRLVKSRCEVDWIRAAAALADRALAHIASLVRPGVREREIALEGEFLMRREGAEAAAFDVIVASGPRSALPHAETTARELQPGDLVVIDIGARVNGYCSDMTRTFAVKSTSPQAREVYDLVYRAQRAGAGALRGGIACGEVDAVARSIIEDAGYGEAFGHGLGHGVGIEVHEAPRLGRGEETELAPGHIVTIEPGVYLPELGGVRLEDLLAVGPDGAERLTGSAMEAEIPIIR